MKQSLHLNISPQLAMTPQLQQSIRLLQLSTFDLQQEIQEHIESNPMLESTPSQEDEDLIATIDEHERDDFQWDSLYTNTKLQQNFNEDRYTLEQLNPSPYNLQDHLRWQLELTSLTDLDKMIGTAIIDSMNEDGFLTCSIEELYQSLKSNLYQIDITEIEAVRHCIQQFDPFGCGSKNLQEMLILQLQQQPSETPYLALTKTIIQNDITMLAKHQYHPIMKNYDINETTLSEILHLIHTLKPRPGASFHTSSLNHHIPDLSVKKVGNNWQVELNPYSLPHLSINAYYVSILKKTNNPLDYQFLKNNLQEAHWLLKSIQSRQDTLLKVSCYIVNYQRDFLNFGLEAMKPLTLNDVAHALDMHESTISRITSQKYIHTPRGLFELRYFFSSHVSTIMGGECSSTAIKALIKKIIHSENGKHPLSDQKIMMLIHEQGINIARRTVAKYRELMGILPSHERKSISC